MKLLMDLAERGLLADGVVRFGIRRLLAGRLAELEAGGEAARRQRLEAFVATMASSPVALPAGAANRQHYELPAELFRLVLGPRLKYSACWWPEGVATLAEAEEATLALTVERAGIEDGMTVLDLGCGWGSLSLWVAEKHPTCQVLAVSNSRLQREHILARAAERGLLGNLSVITADVADLALGLRFDRVVSVEMFEHLRNWRAMLDRVADWLEPGGAMLLHVFCHRRAAYPYEVRDASDWMTEHFFTGGMMPSADLPHRLGARLGVAEEWRLDGRDYSRTLDAWLGNLDHHRDAVRAVLAEAHGDDAERWLERWRLFFMACSELFAWDDGREWLVGHYRLTAAAAGGGGES